MRDRKPVYYLFLLIIIFFHGNFLLAGILPDSSDKNSSTKTDSAEQIIERPNLISNPDFDNLNSRWVLGKHNGVSAIFTIDSTMQLSGTNSAWVHIKETSGNPSDLQLFQNVNVNSDSVYALSFLAKVSKIRNLVIAIDNGFDVIYQKTITLRPDQKVYGPFKFTGFPNEYFTTMSFNLGEDDTDVLIDHFNLETTPQEPEISDMQSNAESNNILPESLQYAPPVK